MKKKNRKAKFNNIKLAELILVTVLLGLNLYAWWSSGIITTLSSSASSIMWASIHPLFLITVIAGIIYFLTIKPKNAKSQMQKFGILALILLTLLWVSSNYSILRDRINPPPDNAPFVTLQGKVIDKDAPNGPGIYTINELDSNKTLEIHVGPKESCDDQAVNIPVIEVGDRLLVYAKQYSSTDNYVSICTEGTFVSKL